MGGDKPWVEIGVEGREKRKYQSRPELGDELVMLMDPAYGHDHE
jgi:hypothetical protein